MALAITSIGATEGHANEREIDNQNGNSSSESPAAQIMSGLVGGGVHQIEMNTVVQTQQNNFNGGEGPSWELYKQQNEIIKRQMDMMDRTNVTLCNVVDHLMSKQ